MADDAGARRDAIARYQETMRDVPGWLDVIDVIVMQLVDELQAEVGLTGDLLEIGAYQGRSAILLQYFCRGGERLSVCDVFESPAFNDENEHEREFFYRDLTRQSFERHFRRIHADLPIIFQCKSHELASRLAGQAFRIIHIDGGHVHEVVRHDVQLAKHLLIEGGAVVIDVQEVRALRLLHEGGLAPALRHRRAQGQ